MTREPLDKNQQIALSQLRSVNAKWSERPTSQRVGLMLLAIVILWAVGAVVGWLLSRQVGVSGVAIACAVAVAVLFAFVLLARAIWLDALLKWSVRVNVPSQDSLERGPWMGFGDIRPADFRKGSSTDQPPIVES